MWVCASKWSVVLPDLSLVEGGEGEGIGVRVVVGEGIVVVATVVAGVGVVAGRIHFLP